MYIYIYQYVYHNHNFHEKQFKTGSVFFSKIRPCFRSISPTLVLNTMQQLLCFPWTHKVSPKRARSRRTFWCHRVNNDFTKSLLPDELRWKHVQLHKHHNNNHVLRHEMTSIINPIEEIRRSYARLTPAMGFTIMLRQIGILGSGLLYVRDWRSNVD